MQPTPPRVPSTDAYVTYDELPPEWVPGQEIAGLDSPSAILTILTMSPDAGFLAFAVDEGGHPVQIYRSATANRPALLEQFHGQATVQLGDLNFLPYLPYPPPPPPPWGPPMVHKIEIIGGLVRDLQVQISQQIA